MRISLRSSEARFLGAVLIDWTGTGFYLSISAIFLSQVLGFSVAGVGLAMAASGAVAFAGGVPVARLADRVGPGRALIGLHVVRAAPFAVLALTPPRAAAVGALCVIGLADQAASSVTQALAPTIAGPDRRVRTMARYRTVVNLGVTIGTLPAALVLAGPEGALPWLLAANGASYLLAALMVASISRPDRGPAVSRRGVMLPSLPTVGLIVIDGVMSLWQVMINVGLPLWVVTDTGAPRALVAALYATNTILCLLFQIRISRSIASYAGAVGAQRRAGVALAGSCLLIAAAAYGSVALAIAALTLGAAALTYGELVKVSAAWQISFELAPEGRAAEFFATYNLGRVGASVLGPLLLTGVVLPLGTAGWVALSLVFAVAGAMTPPLAARARDRPIRPRRPRAPANAHTMLAPRPVMLSRDAS